jgi:hypothetical protein
MENTKSVSGMKPMCAALTDRNVRTWVTVVCMVTGNFN